MHTYLIYFKEFQALRVNFTVMFFSDSQQDNLLDKFVLFLSFACFYSDYQCLAQMAILNLVIMYE